LRLFDLAVMDFEKARNMGTPGYGVANWFLYKLDEKLAISALPKIVANDRLTAFGYIAAEADFIRLG